MAELEEMKTIFQDCLPIGEYTEKSNEYFNRLKEIIYTNDYDSNPNPLERDRFDHDEPDIQYTYISDALFKEQSSKPKLWTERQSLGDQPDVHEGQVPQLDSEITADLASIPEHQEPRDFEYGEQTGDHTGW
jgi:hypothetical protein